MVQPLSTLGARQGRMAPSERGTGEVRPSRAGGCWRDGPGWKGHLLGGDVREAAPRSRSAAVRALAQRCSTRPQRSGCRQVSYQVITRSAWRWRKPFCIQDFSAEFTVNLHSASGARRQAAPARRTPLGCRVHNSFHSSRSIVDVVSFFLYLSPTIVFVSPGDWMMLLIYITPLLPEFLTVVITSSHHG